MNRLDVVITLVLATGLILGWRKALDDEPNLLYVAMVAITALLGGGLGLYFLKVLVTGS